MRWSFKPTGKHAAMLRDRAQKIARSLNVVPQRTARKNEITGDFIVTGRKVGRLINVGTIEIPGRLVGSSGYEQYEFASIEGGGLRHSITSPSIDGMDTLERDVVADNGDAEEPARVEVDHRLTGFLFGSPVSAGYVLYDSWPSEFDGGVVMQSYVSNYNANYHPTTGAPMLPEGAKVWLVVSVVWSGIGKTRTVIFGDSFIRSETGGYEFCARDEVDHIGLTQLRYRLGARLPAAHYNPELDVLSVAMELEKRAPAHSIENYVETEGAGLVVVVKYERGEQGGKDKAVIDKLQIVQSESELFQHSGVAGTLFGSQELTGYDLPAITTFENQLGNVETLASFRVRARKSSEKLPEGMNDLSVMGQVLCRLPGGTPQITTDYIDSDRKADTHSSMPMYDVAKVYVQSDRDIFLLDEGRPVRFRSMHVLDRADTTVPMARKAHADICLMVTEHESSQTLQTQGELGHGKSEHAPGDSVYFMGYTVKMSGTDTEVAPGEVWTRMFLNDDPNVVYCSIGKGGIAGRARPEAMHRTAKITTYQQEVLDDDDEVIVPLGQVFSTLEGEPALAVVKGREGEAEYSYCPVHFRFGIFYMQKPASQPKYRRVYG